MIWVTCKKRRVGDCGLRCKHWLILMATEKLYESLPVPSFNSYNAITSFDFSLVNFRKIFSADEFWSVLKVSIYYTFFGTAGALLLGLFAAQIMQKTFPGRSIIRGLMLFPYVAPVIAMAFSWVVLFDPFSGVVNAMLQQLELTNTPINFLVSELLRSAFSA